MLECQLCHKKYETIVGLSYHLGFSYNSINHNITSEEYYNKYINENSGKCQNCGKSTKFISIIKGYFKYCSRSCTQKSIEVRNKQKETLIRNYGVDSPLKCKEIKEKLKKTNLKKYGCENVFQNKKVQDKYRNTMIDKYGCSNPSDNNDIQYRKFNNIIKKYGVNHFSKTSEFKSKILNTMYRKLFLSNRLRGLVKPLFKLDEYLGIGDYQTNYKFQCLKCNKEFLDHLMNGHVPICPYCFPKNKSKPELEILSFVQQYFPNAESGNRSILNGQEIDIYIPEIKLGIEFNGLYWHSEYILSNPLYHMNKTNMCQSKGIQLIQIFEDEWIEKQEIVKSILLAKMGKITNKIYARKCQIKEVSNEEVFSFYLENHLQGPINGLYSVGLTYNNNIVSLLTLGRPRYNNSYDYEIYRFCNKLNCIVVGGLSKLIQYLISIQNSKSIIAYCDRRYNTGISYLNIGFKLIGTIEPNCFFNKYNRIWDCGQNIYSNTIVDYNDII